MSSGLVARRYARALFDLAVEAKAMDRCPVRMAARGDHSARDILVGRALKLP